MSVKLRLTATMACCLAVAGGVAACGSSDDSGSTSTATPAADTTASAPAATTAAAKPFTVGYSIPTGQNPWIGTIAKTATSTVEAAGGTVDLADSQLDPAKAVSQVKRFITDQDDVIAVAPAQVPQSLLGVLNQAHGAGTKIFSVEWSFDGTAAPKAPIDGQVEMDRKAEGEQVVAAIRKGAGGAAPKVIYIGLPFPVVGVDTYEAAMNAALGSDKLLANVDNPTDNADGARGPLSGALTAHPDANAIVTYNGPSAQAAVSVVKSAGLEGKVKIYDIQLDTATAKQVADGSIEAAWDLPADQLGTALGKLMTAAGQGAPRSEWAKTVAIPPTEYTKANVADWKDWATGQ